MAIRADDVDLRRDHDLVARFQDGDEVAFEDLYERYFDRLVRFCERQVSDRHAAEELSQEAFTRAYRHLPSLGGERRFYPWLTVIARRLCIDHARRSARVHPAPDIDSGVTAAADGPMLEKETVGLLDNALRRVKPRHREVIVLREFEELSYRDISDRMDAPVTAVETLLHRARRALRRELELVGGPGPWAGLPVVLAVRRAMGRLRGALAPRQDLLAAAATPLAALAAATVISLAPAVAPPSVSTTPVGSSAEVPDAVTSPDADAGGPAGETPPLAPVPGPSLPSGAPADPERVELGPVRAQLGPEGARQAQDEAEGMPLFDQVGPAFVGANVDPTVDDVSDATDVTEPTLPIDPTR